MKRVGIVILGSLILLCAVIAIYNSYNVNIILENNSGRNNGFVNSNSLTMMYETASGSGEYQVASDSEWPQDGYTFNETLSRCENGSTLTWDDENKKVVMQANTSDKCYVYFDVVYIYPIIHDVVSSDISIDRITLTVNIETGTNPIKTYFFSNDNGKSYTSSENNVYTFTNLSRGTMYYFVVYAVDSNGEKSNEYKLSVKTASWNPGATN